MPELIPSLKFLEDLDTFISEKAVRKKVGKKLGLLSGTPLHGDLKIERIINDSAAWSVRIDFRYRIAFEPLEYLSTGNPNWASKIRLLRILQNEDLYRFAGL